jgi:hypothetical protein
MHDKAVEYVWNIHHTIKKESEKNQIKATKHICIFLLHAWWRTESVLTRKQYTNRSRADCHRRSRRTRKSEASGSCPDTRNRLFVFALQNTAESGHVPAPGMGLVEKKAEGKRLQFEKKNATKNCSLTTGPTRYDVGKHVYITQRKRLVNNPAPTVPFSEDQCWVYLPQLN